MSCPKPLGSFSLLASSSSALMSIHECSKVIWLIWFALFSCKNFSLSSTWTQLVSHMNITTNTGYTGKRSKVLERNCAWHEKEEKSVLKTQEEKAKSKNQRVKTAKRGKFIFLIFTRASRITHVYLVFRLLLSSAKSRSKSQVPSNATKEILY